VDARRTLYIGDAINHEVLRVTTDGRVLARWEQPRLSMGELPAISALALDSAGKVYVADFDRGLIRRFAPDGRLEATTTLRVERMHSREPGVFFVPTGALFVVDSQNHRVQKLSSDGQPITVWGTEGTAAGQFLYPRSVALDASGDVYVLDSTRRIQRFSPSGGLRAVIQLPGPLRRDTELLGHFAVDDLGNLYVAEMDARRVLKVAPDGKFLARFGTSLPPPEDVFAPEGVAVDAEGNLWVADVRSLHKFAPSREALEIAPEEIAPRDLERTRALDAQGNEYVTSELGDLVAKHAPNGEVVAVWGGRGGEAGQFFHPMGIATDALGDVYVADNANHRVQKFTPDGIVWVADTGHNRVQAFAPSGEPIGQWGWRGAEPGQFNRPSAIAVDGENNVYVADTLNHRLQQFVRSTQP
jgi:sugar lactone lactonase YvrE